MTEQSSDLAAMKVSASRSGSLFSVSTFVLGTFYIAVAIFAKWWGKFSPGEAFQLLACAGLLVLGARVLFGGRRPILAGAGLGCALGALAWIYAIHCQSAWVGDANAFAELNARPAMFTAPSRSYSDLIAYSIAGLAGGALCITIIVLGRAPKSFYATPFPQGTATPTPAGPLSSDAQTPSGCANAASGSPQCRSYTWSRAAAIILLIAVALLLRPVRILYDEALTRACRDSLGNGQAMPCAPTPLVTMALYRNGLATGDPPNAQLLSLADMTREHLVELGALAHRRFVFPNVQMNQRAAARQLWQEIETRFPTAAYASSPWSSDPVPFIVDVWDVPKNMTNWERFVEERTHPLKKD